MKPGEYFIPPKGMLELWEGIEEEWKAIPDSVCRDLVESIPGRIAAVIKDKGSYLKH